MVSDEPQRNGRPPAASPDPAALAQTGSLDPSSQAPPAPIAPARDLKTLRRTLRANRRQLSTLDQRRHAAALTRLLSGERSLRCARRLAAYWPADGELDPRPLLDLAVRRGRRAFLPVLRPGRGRKLWFVPYLPGDSLRANRLGIAEPCRRAGRFRLAWTLDLILVPLVGFDADGNRLGMGGGFYDRTLGFLRQRRHWQRPRLIGLAHECQRVDQIAARPWDVPLDAVATERRVYWRGRD